MAQWYKHWSGFRNNPAMITLASKGAREALAMYRLLEVVTEVCESDNGFAIVLTLEPPRTESWLAGQLFSPEWDNDQQEMSYGTVQELERFLALASDAGVIERSNFKSDRWTRPKDRGNPEGPREPMVFQRISIVGFDKMLADYIIRGQQNTLKYGNHNNPNARKRKEPA
jgi:hypothetical protein